MTRKGRDEIKDQKPVRGREQKIDGCTYHVVSVFGASLSTNAGTSTFCPFGVWPIGTGS